LPRPAALRALCHALKLDGRAEAELRRLAGIDPDPAATPEARAARRDAWPLLLYALVNHVLLPRLKLADVLSGKRRLAAHDRELIARAAESPDTADFGPLVRQERRPAGALHRMLEHAFRACPADVLQHESFWSEWAASSPAHYHRGRVSTMMLLHLRSGIDSETDAVDFVENFGFDRNFAVRFFPYLYREACLCWPFKKLSLPLGRLRPDAQRQLYDRIRSGLSVEELDQALLGEGELGSTLREHGIRRQTADEQRSGFAGRQEPTALFELDAPDVRGRPPDYCGPPPKVDALFDHLDRSDFLDRFPLLKLDHVGTCKLAASRSLPSWEAWLADVRGHARRLPPDAPPLGSQPFLGSMAHQPLRGRRETGLAIAHVSQAFADAAELLIADQAWPQLLAIADQLPFAQHVTDLIRPLARHPDQPPSPPAHA
jgi:hypothetical protein